jgi:citrate synthase
MGRLRVSVIQCLESAAKETDMDEAVLRIGDREITLPVITGSEGELAIDINKLRAQTGIVSHDKGFANTAEALSSVTFLDGEDGILRYRGFPIEQIADSASFLEVSYLCLYGELPTAAQYGQFVDEINHHTMVREDMKHLYEAFPADAHPMQMLASAVSALATFYPDSLDPTDEEAIDLSAKRLIGKMITLAAWGYKYSLNQPFQYPRNDLDYTSNFLHMMFSYPTEPFQVDPVISKALDVLLNLHADHEQNCSTSTVRMVGSSQANLFSSVASGIHALSGPLHGGANQRVVEMLDEIIKGGGDVSKYIAKAKDKDDPFRLMGFGHRVYKNFDPRARIIKSYAGDVLEKLGKDDPMLDVAVRLEEVALSDEYFAERKLYPNVDFYSGIIYKAMGFPIDIFTVLFAIGRLPGWIAQWKEMRLDPTTRIGRPRQIYVGEAERKFVVMDQR